MGDSLSMGCIREMRRAETLAELTLSAQAIIERLGASFFVMAQLRSFSGAHSPALVARTEGHPWVEHYVRNTYHVEDPVLARALRCDRLFGWQELINDIDLAPMGQKIMADAHDHGLHCGLTFPIHGRNTGDVEDKSVLIFSVAGEKLQEDNLLTRGAMVAAGLELFDAARRIGYDGRNAIFSRGVGRVEPSDLTENERAYLSWRAQGKSREDIAEILGKSNRAVRSLADSARKKLGAADEVQMVLIARDHNMLY